MALLLVVLEKERRICVSVNQVATWRYLGRMFAKVSRLGDGVVWYVLMGLLALLGGTRGVATAAVMLVTGLLTLVLYKALKERVARPRPLERLESLTINVPPLDRWSFPSGHTMHAVAFSVVAIAAFPVLAWVLVPFTSLVMMSRVVLGLHYPTDVVAGALCGAGVAVVCVEVAAGWIL